MPGRTLQIRMTPELAARLDMIANGLSIPPATLGRAALVAWLDSIERNGVLLPVPSHGHEAILNRTEVEQ